MLSEFRIVVRSLVLCTLPIDDYNVSLTLVSVTTPQKESWSEGPGYKKKSIEGIMRPSNYYQDSRSLTFLLTFILGIGVQNSFRSPSCKKSNSLLAATCIEDCSCCWCPVERDSSKQAVGRSPTIGVDHPLKERGEKEETGTSAGHQDPSRGSPGLRKLFLHSHDPAGVDGGQGGGEEEPVGEVEGGERGSSSCIESNDHNVNEK